MKELIESLAQKILGGIDEALSGELQAAFKAQQTSRDIAMLWVGMCYQLDGGVPGAGKSNEFMDWYKTQPEMQTLILEGLQRYAKSLPEDMKGTAWIKALAQEALNG